MQEHNKSQRTTLTTEPTERTEKMPINEITEAIIRSAIRVHSALGPGLLESAYQGCLAWELHQLRLNVQTQVTLPLVYEGIKIDAGYRIDFRVEDLVIVEVKSVEKLLPVHQAQLLSYLKLSGIRVGLLINFNVKYVVDGIRRLIL